MHVAAPAPAPSSSSSPASSPDVTSEREPETKPKAIPMVNLVAFTSSPDREGTRIEGAWVRPAPHANLLQEFEGWEGEVRALLELVAGEGSGSGSGVAKGAAEGGGGVKGAADNEEKDDVGKEGRRDGDEKRKGDERDGSGPPPLPLLWAIHVVKPLPKYVGSGGRVVLVGDAVCSFFISPMSGK